MFWNTFEHVERRLAAVSATPERGRDGASSSTPTRSFLHVPSHVPVHHPTWQPSSTANAAIAKPPRGNQQQQSQQQPRVAGDPILHKFFELRRQPRAKPVGRATPQQRVVAVGHSGAYVITADSQAQRMPDEFYASPEPRPFLSYAAGGSNADLYRRWKDDPELYAKKLDVKRQVHAAAAGNLRAAGEGGGGKSGGGDSEGESEGAGSSSGRGRTRRGGGKEKWTPMTVDDILVAAPAGEDSDDGRGGGDTGGQLGGNSDDQLARDIHES
jgi:hypothetical protein